MRSPLISVLTVLSVSAAIVPAVAAPAYSFLERSITTDATSVADKSFDFVVVGGGLAGLVVASRLSEDANTTVLVIEAGGDGTEVELRRDVPGFAYMRGLAFGSPYSANWTTTNQCGLDQPKQFPVPRGLGGGSAVNGMFWTRPGSAEYDAWSELNGGQGWNWTDLNGYINKAEGLTEASPDAQHQFNIINNNTAHGTTGPLKVGWPSYIYNVTETWIPSWQSLGIPAHDLASGSNRGVAIVPSTLNPATGTRSDSDNSYLAEDRPNVVVLTEQLVTKIEFNGTVNGSLVASGVQFQASATSQSYSVKANKEVIVSSGTIGSPKLLQLSGIGPSSVLSPLNVSVNVDLPVGYNFQDHVLVVLQFGGNNDTETWYPLCTNTTMQDEALTQWQATKDGPLTYVNEATGYASMADLGATLQVDTAAVLASHSKYNLPDSVQKGYNAQWAILQTWLSSEVPQLETILNLLGATATGAQLEAAIQHPWSRGTVFIQSGNAFDEPLIDPNYLGVDADISLVTAGVGFVRKLLAVDPIKRAFPQETAPGANTTGDALVTWMKSNCGSEYHPVGSCPMLPQDIGGVVDTNLVVYGTRNVRVIDASIVPLQVSAHTMSSTYGIAEKGADLIKAFYGAPVSSPAGQQNVSLSSSGSLPSAAKTSAVSSKPSASSGASPLSLSWAALVALVAIPAFF